LEAQQWICQGPSEEPTLDWRSPVCTLAPNPAAQPAAASTTWKPSLLATPHLRLEVALADAFRGRIGCAAGSLPSSPCEVFPAVLALSCVNHRGAEDRRLTISQGGAHASGWQSLLAGERFALACQRRRPHQMENRIPVGMPYPSRHCSRQGERGPRSPLALKPSNINPLRT
jgi:hypothetical protein